MTAEEGPAGVPEPAGVPSEDRSPIFVVGHGRSGTTMLAAMLNAHRRLACGPETAFFDLVGHARWRRIVKDPRWPEKALDFLVSMERDTGGSVLDAYGVDADDARLELASRTPSLSAMLEAVTVPYARAHGKQRWVEKTPRHLLRVREIRELWPEAIVVRIVRDPRAVAASFRNVPFGPTSAVGAAYQWRSTDDATWRFFEADPRAITVRYEALVQETEPELRRLCDLMGEDFDPRMLRPAESGSVSLTATGEHWKSRVLEPVDATRVGAWRDEVSGPDQRRIELICGDGMRRYGYDGARQPQTEAWLKPLDAATIAEAEPILRRAADEGLVFRMSVTRWRSERGRLVLVGAEGQLRWAVAGRAASARAVTRWGFELARARARGRPVIWVRRRTERPERRTLAERVGDALVRGLAVETDAERVVALLVET